MKDPLNISLDWKKNLQFVATNDKTNYQVYIDTAEAAVGGEKKGTGSKHLFLQAIAGCSAQVVIMMLQKMKAVMPTKFNVDITGKLTDEHPMIFKTIDFTYKFEGETEVGKIKKAIKLSEDKYCGLTFTVANLGIVKSNIIVNGKSI